MQNYRFDPELAPLVGGLPTLDLDDLPTLRKQMRPAEPAAGSLTDTVEVRTVRIDAFEDGPTIELRIVTPVQSTGPTAALVFIHGGGFLFGDVADVSLPVEWARRLGIVVVSVGYRLAPEYRYPAALDDCRAALAWTAEHASDLGIDPTRIGVGGVSAGAGLTAAVCLAVRDKGGPPVRFQLLDIPMLDDRLSTPSMRAFHDTPIWTRDKALQGWSAYLGPNHDGPTPAYAAPARADDLSGLPPAYVTACEFDPLRDEAIEYAYRLTQAGVATELHTYPGTFHGVPGVCPDTNIAARMREDRLNALARGLGVVPVTDPSSRLGPVAQVLVRGVG